MRIFTGVLAVILAANAAAAAPVQNFCYEKIFSKAELRKLPLQDVTAIRIALNLLKTPETGASINGRIEAMFRDDRKTWWAAPFECSDTGAGLACTTICDASIFILAAGSTGLQLLPQGPVNLSRSDCNEDLRTLTAHADSAPFALTRRSRKACPAR